MNKTVQKNSPKLYKKCYGICCGSTAHLRILCIAKPFCGRILKADSHSSGNKSQRKAMKAKTLSSQHSVDMQFNWFFFKFLTLSAKWFWLSYKLRQVVAAKRQFSWAIRVKKLWNGKCPDQKETYDLESWSLLQNTIFASRANRFCCCRFCSYVD